MREEKAWSNLQRASEIQKLSASVNCGLHLSPSGIMMAVTVELMATVNFATDQPWIGSDQCPSYRDPPSPSRHRAAWCVHRDSTIFRNRHQRVHYEIAGLHASDQPARSQQSLITEVGPAVVMSTESRTQKPSDAHLGTASYYKFTLGQVQSQLGIRSSWLIEFLVWAILQPGINRLHLLYLGSTDSICIPGINRLYLHTWDQQTLSAYLGSTDSICIPGINRLYLHTWDQQTLSAYLGSTDSISIPGINRLYLHTWDQQTLSAYLGSTDSICIPGINRLYLHTWDQQTLSAYLGSTDSFSIPGINRLYLHTWDQQTLSAYLMSKTERRIGGWTSLE
ncbi:hypothetical protein RRG08_041504 [Elysia crispata]|uniref:Uncharacterized protein n=1 Tax=Elysia crispata TaxID=231223 RepID=A0AAE0YKH2_9GAST|nr:hypothetical protein RRG08_041504 [Elysia crispata]